MSEPFVSCIVPCFNGERFLSECIQSIVEQSHRPGEIIVVDDGSTDGSADIVRSFGDLVRYHRQPNGGPAAACNTGLRLARGAFVAFLEQDDLWEKRKLERQIAEFGSRKDLDYCVSFIQNFWTPDLQDQSEFYHNHPVMQPVPGYVVQTLLARRRAFEKVGKLDEDLRFACATDWFVRAREAGAKGNLVDDVLTRRRLHRANFSRRNREESRDQFLHVIKAMLDRRRYDGEVRET